MRRLSSALPSKSKPIPTTNYAIIFTNFNPFLPRIMLGFRRFGYRDLSSTSMVSLLSTSPFILSNNHSPDLMFSNRPTPKIRMFLCCSGRKETQFPDTDPENQKIKKEKKEKSWALRFGGEIVKVGRGLKECLAPKQKGDWKDVMLMSISFAVYVYISQKIVCAYCAWTSIVNHHY